MTLFPWLDELFRGIFKFIPRIVLVRTTHEGVAFVFGRYQRIITSHNGLFGTGIHLFWPIICEVDIVPIKRQTTRLAKQCLNTKDRRQVGLCGILVYEVVDTEKLLTECFDYEDTICDIGLYLIKEIVSGLSYDELLDPKIDQLLTRRMKTVMRGFGVKVIRFTLSDVVSMRVHGLWGVGNEPQHTVA